MKSVLFVCSFNKGRGVVAEHLLRRMLSDRDSKLAEEVEVSSAGLVTREFIQAWKQKGLPPPPRSIFGDKVEPYVIEALLSKGIDVRNHSSRPLTKQMVEKASLIITMEQCQRERILSLYSRTEGKVFTLADFVGETRRLVIEDKGLPGYDPESNTYFQTREYNDACMAEIEQCLTRGVETFIHYLKQANSGGGRYK